jgi:predicted ATP-binding protein involved in virulence
VLIDEGELYLHPSWQKKMLSILMDFLPVVFPQARIQIILTSHSPFVLSDLPKTNVILLTTESDLPSSSDILQHQQTLAANIHTLLADTFFMDDGFTGNYAKKKIDEVITDLKSADDIAPQRKAQIKKIILSVGEPIIQRKLLQLFETRFNMGLDDRISRIEQRLGL